MSANGPYLFGFIDALVRINFPHGSNFLIGGDEGSPTSAAFIDGSQDGSTWSGLLSLPGGQGVYSLSGANNVWVATTESAIWRSTDSAQTWTQVQSGSFQHSHSAGKLFAGKSKATFVVVVENDSSGVWVSQDDGATWNHTSIGDPANDTFRFCVSAGDFIFVGGYTASGLTDSIGLILATRDGVTWSRNSNVFGDIPSSTFTTINVKGVAAIARTVGQSTVNVYSAVADTTVTVFQTSGGGGTGDTPLQRMATAASSDGINWGGSTLYGDGGVDFGFGAQPAQDTIYTVANRSATIDTMTGGPLMAGGPVFVILASKFVGANNNTPVTYSAQVGYSGDGGSYSFVTLNEYTSTNQTNNYVLSCVGSNGRTFVIGGMDGRGAGAFYDATVATPFYYASSDGVSWSPKNSDFPVPPSNLGVWAIGAGAKVSNNAIA